MQKTIRIFGRRVRALRKSRGWTLEQLGKKAHLGYKHVADIERAVKTPSFDAIDRLAAALDVHPYELFLPSNEPGADPALRFKDLIREFERVRSPAVKQLVVELFDLARNMQGSLVVSSRER